MSTTPSTIKPAYTVVGTAAVPMPLQRFDYPVSLVVLTRDSWLYRLAVLEEFYQLGFSEVLCIETAPLKYVPNEVLERLPGLRLMILSQPCTVGEKINLAAAELTGESFLVLWDDQKLPEAGLHTKVNKLWQETTALLLVPELRDTEGKEVPGVLVPSLDQNRLRVLALPNEDEHVSTLFPQDLSGLYNREMFLRSGGFDPEIQETYWQKVDWGTRCHLWGEQLLISRVFRLDLRLPVATEDQSAGSGSLRFYLKNLALRYTGDHAVLPWSRFPLYWRHSGSTFFGCLSDFRNVRAWVHRNRYRFKADAKMLVERW